MTSDHYDTIIIGAGRAVQKEAPALTGARGS